MNRITRVALWYIAVPVFSVGIAFLIVFWTYIFLWDGDFGDSQEDVFLRFRLPLRTEVLDSEGNRLIELPGINEKREVFYCGKWLSYEDFPQIMVQAALAAEDKRFFSHDGVDGNAMMRAALVIARESIKSMEVIFAEGASTITQQAVSIVFIPDSYGREHGGNVSKIDKVKRKIKKIRIALRLEKRFAKRFGSKERAKQKIFEVFANASYCGGGRYGFEAASQFYFGNGVNAISADEAALLAGLVRNPGRYSPRVNRVNALLRRNQILGLMQKDGFLDALSAEKYMLLPIIVKDLPHEKTIAPSVAGRAMKEIWGHGKKLAWENGATVHTHIRYSWQIAANDALMHGLEAYAKRHPEYKDKIQGAVVVLTNDGKIRAMTGGARIAYPSFNRADEAKRQPGSAFKPFVYVAALENGWRISSVWDGEGPFLIYDAPISVPMGNGRSPHVIQNYDGRFLGNIELWQALAESRNAATVRLAAYVTPKKVVDVARRFGLNMDIEAYPTTAIGAEEVTPLELADAYLVFANNGSYVPSQLIESVEYANGNIFAPPAEDWRKVLDEDVELQILAGLRHTILWQSGTGRKLRELPFAVAGKTGTSNDFRDAWFCGFTYGTDGITACVWVGMDDGTPLGDGDKCNPRDPIGRKFCEPGGRVALPIFEELIAAIYKENPPDEFPKILKEKIAEAHRRAVIPRQK